MHCLADDVELMMNAMLVRFLYCCVQKAPETKCYAGCDNGNEYGFLGCSL